MHIGVLELIDFIKKENIKTLVEHIVDQHLERYCWFQSQRDQAQCMMFHFIVRQPLSSLPKTIRHGVCVVINIPQAHP